MRTPRLIFCALASLAALASAVGCRPMTGVARPVLAEARLPTDSIVLDLYYIRVPFGDPQANELLWQELDEQQLSLDLRERLRRHGFRAGVSGLNMPSELERLFGRPTADAPTEEITLKNLDEEAVVLRRHLQVSPGKQSEVLASLVYPQLPLIEVQPNGEIVGQTYHKAEGAFTLRAFPERDGRVRIQLRPELQHGDAKQEVVQREGYWMMEARRPRRAFDQLALEARLSPGEMLVLSCRPEMTGTPGYYFFSEPNTTGVRQKLLVIRLSQTQYDDLELSDLPSESPAEH